MAANDGNGGKQSKKFLHKAKDVVATVGPAVLITATLGAAIKGSQMFRNQLHNDDEAVTTSRLKAYPHFNALAGSNPAVKKILYFSTLSTCWHEDYFENCENIVLHRKACTDLVETCESLRVLSRESLAAFRKRCHDYSTLNEQQALEMRAAMEAECRTQLENVDYVNQLIQDIHLRLAINLEKTEAMMHIIESCSVEIERLANAFNIYADNVMGLFHVDLANITDEKVRNMILERKLLTVQLLFKFGLSPFLGHSFRDIQSLDVLKSMLQMSVDDYVRDILMHPDGVNLVEFGVANDFITAHVQFWTRMHVTYSPQCREVAQLLGWTEAEHCEVRVASDTKSGFSIQHIAEKALAKLNGGSNDEASTSQGKPQTTEARVQATIAAHHQRPINSTGAATKHSGIKQRMQRFVERWKQEGFMSVASKPWHGLTPSPVEPTFVLTSIPVISLLRESLLSVNSLLHKFIENMFQSKVVIEASDLYVQKDLQQLRNQVQDMAMRYQFNIDGHSSNGKTTAIDTTVAVEDAVRKIIHDESIRRLELLDYQWKHWA